MRAGLAKGNAQHKGQRGKQDQAGRHSELAKESKRDEQNRSHQHEDIVLARVAFACVQGPHQRGNAQHQQNIRRVRANDIAKRDAVGVVPDRTDRDQQFRR